MRFTVIFTESESGEMMWYGSPAAGAALMCV